MEQEEVGEQCQAGKRRRNRRVSGIEKEAKEEEQEDEEE